MGCVNGAKEARTYGFGEPDSDGEHVEADAEVVYDNGHHRVLQAVDVGFGLDLSRTHGVRRAMTPYIDAAKHRYRNMCAHSVIGTDGPAVTSGPVTRTAAGRTISDAQPFPSPPQSWHDPKGQALHLLEASAYPSHTFCRETTRAYHSFLSAPACCYAPLHQFPSWFYIPLLPPRRSLHHILIYPRRLYELKVARETSIWVGLLSFPIASFQHDITKTGLAIPRPRSERPVTSQPPRRESPPPHLMIHDKRRRPGELYATGGGSTGWAEAAADGSALRACKSSQLARLALLDSRCGVLAFRVVLEMDSDEPGSYSDDERRPE
ncbi:hypothetical protein BJ912DRAFT_1044851 [Pholiota molesta]|nr:hypothetical protein BJ912DRAFT_1044851 [Pholiota molesta]